MNFPFYPGWNWDPDDGPEEYQPPKRRQPTTNTAKFEDWDVQRPVTAQSRKGLEENKRIEMRAQAVEAKIKTVKERILQKFGQPLSHPELFAICMFVSKELEEPIDRDASRRTKALLAWCAERLDTFLKVLHGVEGKYEA